jgi:hypothetical protein
MRRTARAACALALATGAVIFGASRANAENVLNLTTAGSSGFRNGAKFETNIVQPTGSGVIHSFVRISQANQAIVEGYNTDGRPVQFQENTSPTFTHSIKLTDLQIVKKGNVDYYAFLLDINQEASVPKLNLNELQVYLADAPDLHSGFVSETGFAGHSALVYSIDQGADGDSGLLMDYNLNSGSGSGDIWAFIPTANFANKGAANKYVYLYSKFGDPEGNNDGYEEWAAVVGPNSSPVPLPASVWGGLTLIGAMGVAKIRARRRSA